MKLSEMSTDQFIDTVNELAAPVAEVAENEPLMEAFGAIAEAWGKKQIYKVAMLAVTKAAPEIHAHKAALYAILSTLTGKSAGELAVQKFSDTINDAISCIDAELKGFFS